ncbi:hypothetical protein A1O3_07674 [Capronia epimyces CBS 606.96]|uniref:F-box domain-containing protein n=1 Tax=Capronia epimyces CBS 606.96 TaxID=1182542 RepID=W9XMG8_9EURO|nr:uncharacterized protein A1O3_07674 [Capronia epimyces CBS 606.96]EXJ81383.1 hypothetical protein A1O3_07674 [Capronia epimyces CBS 606.96]
MDERNSPLTKSELAFTYPPYPSDNLGHLELDKLVRLSYHRLCKEPKHDLGVLDLPVETLNMIMGHLDLRSLMSLQRVNRRAFHMVNAMPELGAIMEYSPNALRAIFAIKTGRFITCRMLFAKLCSYQCETCSEFAGYLYVLTCKRVCYHCFTSLPKYLPVLRSDARERIGLPADIIKQIPQMKSVPGRYTALHRRRPRRTLMDATAVREAGIALHGNARAVECYSKKVAAEKLEAYRVSRRKLEPDLVDHNIDREYSFNLPRDEYYFNPRRFMAIVSVPFIDIQDRRAHWGFHCLACLTDVKGIKSSDRQYIASLFRDHLQEDGEIIREKHFTKPVAKIQGPNPP